MSTDYRVRKAMYITIKNMIELARNTERLSFRQERKIRKRETCNKSNMAMVKYAITDPVRNKKGSNTCHEVIKEP
jgi:hypothetical protein